MFHLGIYKNKGKYKLSFVWPTFRIWRNSDYPLIAIVERPPWLVTLWSVTMYPGYVGIKLFRITININFMNLLFGKEIHEETKDVAPYDVVRNISSGNLTGSYVFVSGTRKTYRPMLKFKAKKLPIWICVSGTKLKLSCKLNADLHSLCKTFEDMDCDLNVSLRPLCKAAKEP